MQADRCFSKMTDPAAGAGHDDTVEQPEDATSPVEHNSPAAAEASHPTTAPTDEAVDVASEDELESGNEAATDTTAEDSEDGDEDGEHEDEDVVDEEVEDIESDEDEEDEEPRLKYARMTQHLGGLYRNADATSSFLVSGDKMVWIITMILP